MSLINNKLILLTIFFVIFTNTLQVHIVYPQTAYSTFEQVRDRQNLKLSLNSADKFIYADSKKNTFTIPSLVSNRNMIQVVSNLYLYPILMIDQRVGTPAKYNLINPVTRQIIQSVQQPIMIKPLDKINYFDPQGGFSIKSVLFSGYGMMIGFGALLYFCYQNIMPKLEQAQEAPTN